MQEEQNVRQFALSFSDGSLRGNRGALTRGVGGGTIGLRLDKGLLAGVPILNDGPPAPEPLHLGAANQSGILHHDLFFNCRGYLGP